MRTAYNQKVKHNMPNNADKNSENNATSEQQQIANLHDTIANKLLQ